MVDITSTFMEITTLPQFSDYKEFLLSNCSILDMNSSLEQMQKNCYDWVAESIVYGLNRGIALIDSGIQTVYDIYTQEELENEPDKKGTKLFFMPGKKDMPFVIVCPGGAYASVCTIKEGFPVGARLNELGYNAFILSYRVKELDGQDNTGIMPKPLEDMAAALRFIRAHSDELRVQKDAYAVAGFSSGGHLAAEWGTDNCGSENYGLPKPNAIFLAYPAIDPTLYPSFGERNVLLELLLGNSYTQEDLNRYNVNANIGKDFPATYVWHCVDDTIIPVLTSQNLVKQLEESNVPYYYKEVPRGGHGFGLGEFSEANGWLEEAVAFFETRLITQKQVGK